MPGLTSASGLIGLLDEPDQQLKCYALQNLDKLVDQFWAEIADSVSKMFVKHLFLRRRRRSYGFADVSLSVSRIF